MQLWYPELAASDAYKAYLLLDESKYWYLVTGETSGTSGSHLWQSMVDVKLLLAQALFLANCFYECVNLLKTCPYTREIEALSLVATKALERDIAHHKQDEDFQNMELPAQEEHLAMGEIMTTPYPWAQNINRKPAKIREANRELERLSNSCCVIQDCQNLRSKLAPGHPGWHPISYGIYTSKPISEGQMLFTEKTVLVGSGIGSTRCCFGCARDFNDLTPIQIRGELFCDPWCAETISDTCEIPSRINWKPPRKSLGFSHDIVHTPERKAELNLLSRVFATAVKFTNQDPQHHPLSAPFINRLTANYHKKTHFSLYFDIIEPTRILKTFNVDIFADERYESWVVQTILARIAVNSRQSDLRGPQAVAINSFYSFFNHSCSPNVEAELHPSCPGQLFLRSTRTIGANEELCISYLDDDQLSLAYEDRRAAMWPWTGGDCQCNECRAFRERRRLRRLRARSPALTSVPYSF